MIIRRETLQAALAATTSDNSRYFLNAVQAEPAHNRVVATNGHILLIATDNAAYKDEDFPQVPGAGFHGDPAGPVTLDADICKGMIAAMPKRPTLAILATAQLSVNGSPETVTLAATDLQAPRVATINTADAGRFPAWERVMPTGEAITMCLAVDVLEQLIKASKAVGSKHITFDVPTKHTNVATALGVSMKGTDVTVTGCAMPCRI